MNSSQGELLPIQSHPRFRLISLFAGAGGFTLGFTKEFNHNFELVWANDINQHAVSTFNANFAQPCVLGDLRDILKDSNIEIPTADVVIGSPPIQAFSAAGKKIESDSIQQLWKLFLEVVERSKAQTFVMQYNHGLLHPRFLSHYKDILKAIEELGFHIAQKCLCATDFGVPQRRQRVFLIGCRFADPSNFFPLKTHGNPNNDLLLSQLAPWRTVRDAIADLPPPESIGIRDEPPPLDLHFGYRRTQQILERYQAALNSNQLYRTGIRRLRWDEPASAIVPLFFPVKWGGYLHPEQDRLITHREAARLQSFPDSFRFCGTSYTIAQQIGYAVPPLLAARIADSVHTLLSSRKELENPNVGQLVLSSQPSFDLLTSPEVEEIDISDQLKEISLNESAITQNAKATELIEKLNQIQPGRNSWREYEDVCIEILNYLFIPPFNSPKIQSTSENGLERRDAIYSFSSGDPFWSIVRIQFNTWLVVAEFKNLVKAPNKKAVESIKEYLYPESLRSFGILCTREEASNSALEARRKAWKESQKMIVFLCDDDLIKMLLIKANNGEPSKVIETQINDFLATLSP